MDATVSVGKQESLPFGVFSGNYGQDETPSKAALFMQRIRREDSINEDYDDEQEELIKTVRQEPREIPLSPISDVCVVEETEEGLFSTVRRLDPKLMSSVFDNSQPSPSSISDAATPKKRTSLGRSPRRSSGATTPMSSKRRRSSLLRRRSSDKSQSRRSSLQLDGYEEGELEKSNHTDKDDVNSVRTTPSRSGRRSSDAQKTFKPAVSPQKRSSEGGKRSSVETTGNESVGRKRSSIEHSLTVDGIHKSPKTGGKASRRWSAVRKITLSDDVDNQRRSSLLQIPSNERRITTPTRNLGSVVTLMMKQERETKEFSDQMSDLRERLTTNRTRLQSLKGKPDEVDTIEERVNLISKIHEDEVLETQLLEDFDNFKKQSLTTDEDQRIWRGFLASKAIRREHTEQKEEAKRVQEVRSKETIKFKLRHEKEQNIKLSTKEKMKQIEQIESKRSEEEQELKAKMNELKQQYQEQQKKVSALEIGSATQYEYVVEKGVLNTIDIAQLELKKQIETLPERFITPTLTPEEERAARGLQAFQAARQLRLSQVSEAKRLQGAKEESKKLAGAAATKQRLAEIEDIRKSLTTKTEFLKFTEEHYYHSRDILIERRDFAESSLTSIELIVNSQQKQLSVFYIPTVLQTKLMETSLSFCNEVSKLNDEIENLSILHAADAQIAQLTPTERIEQRAQRGVKRKSKDTITSPTLGPNTGTAFNPPPSPLLGALDVSNVTTLLSSLRNRNAVSQAGVTAPQIKKQTQQQPTSTTIRKLSLSELHPVDQITELKGHILGESITLSNSGEQLFYEISEADSEIAKLVEEVKRIEIDIEMLSQTSHVAITLCASMALEIINDVEKQRRERELLEKESSASPACSSATFSFQVTEEVASVGASSPQGSFRSTIRTSKLLVGDSYNNHPLSGSNKSSLASLTPPPSDAQLAAAICILIHTTCDSNNCYHSTHSISVLNTTTAEDVATALLYLTPSLGNPTVLPPSTVVSPSTTIRSAAGLSEIGSPSSFTKSPWLTDDPLSLTDGRADGVLRFVKEAVLAEREKNIVVAVEDETKLVVVPPSPIDPLIGDIVVERPTTATTSAWVVDTNKFGPALSWVSPSFEQQLEMVSVTKKSFWSKAWRTTYGKPVARGHTKSNCDKNINTQDGSKQRPVQQKVKSKKKINRSKTATRLLLPNSEYLTMYLAPHKPRYRMDPPGRGSISLTWCGVSGVDFYKNMSTGITSLILDDEGILLPQPEPSHKGWKRQHLPARFVLSNPIDVAILLQVRDFAIIAAVSLKGDWPASQTGSFLTADSPTTREERSVPTPTSTTILKKSSRRKNEVVKSPPPRTAAAVLAYATRFI